MNVFFSPKTNGFYPSSLKPTYIASGTWPNDAVELSEIELDTYWQQQPPAGQKLSSDANGRPVWVDLPAPSLAEALDAKSKQIDIESQKFIDANIPSYPNFEMLTFEKQESEARAYIADNTVSTPVLTPIATERGMTVLDLADKVITKANAFTALSASVAGQRQKYQDQLAAAYDGGNGSLSAINAIDPVFTAPA
ncbi:MAG: hypothetical protein DSZ27_07340 [Thiomicrospira sp.]|nr:MAG: hypothetical protein DSZ27_07340 [Thiomicrospira sp.]